MSKKALYTVSVRLSKETIQQLEKYQKKHHLKSRSECLQQAVERYLNPQNPDEKDLKTILREAFADQEIQKTIKELCRETFENTPVTLTRIKN